MTDDFEVFSDEYSTFVQSFVGTEVFNSSSITFSPLSNSKFICSFQFLFQLGVNVLHYIYIYIYNKAL